MGRDTRADCVASLVFVTLLRRFANLRFRAGIQSASFSPASSVRLPAVSVVPKCTRAHLWRSSICDAGWIGDLAFMSTTSSVNLSTNRNGSLLSEAGPSISLDDELNLPIEIRIIVN